MNDLELRRQLRTTIDGAAPPVSAADARLRARDTSSRPTLLRRPGGPWTHHAMVAAVAAVILAVFFVPSPHLSLFHRLVSPASPSTTIGSAPVEIQLVLDETEITAGTPIRGEALLTNTTGKPLTVDACAADGWLSVGLTNAQVSYDPAGGLVGCLPSVVLSPGLNRFPISISSHFQSCTQASGHASPQSPPCIGRAGMAPLPAGHYVTKIVVTGLPPRTELPPAIAVTLLPG